MNKICINCLKEINNEEAFCLNCHEEVVNILKKQLQNAIIPKFKVGQIVYTFNKNTDCIYELCIKTIRIERHEFSKYNHMIYFAERLEDKHFFGYFEEELFSTKEELLTTLEDINK